MDSNYEAQKQYLSQRLACRREQAAAERMVKVGRTKQMGPLRRLLAWLLRRPIQKHGRTPSQQDLLAEPALNKR